MNQFNCGKLMVKELASEKVRSALVWSDAAHRGQSRKQTPNNLTGDKVPYFIHTVSVMNILSASGADRNLVCAGCLHDVIEDTNVTEEQIGREFGEEVASLVKAVSKNSSLKSMPLDLQAAEVVKSCGEVGEKAFVLKAADLFSNMSDLVWTIESEGVAKVQELYGKARWKEKVNHYIELANLLSENIVNYSELTSSLQERKDELIGLI